MKKTSDAQLRATLKWQEKNREQANRIKKRSAARNFIKKHADTSELLEFEELIKIRKNELRKEEIQYD